MEVAEGTENQGVMNKHQLETVLNTKVDASLDQTINGKKIFSKPI